MDLFNLDNLTVDANGRVSLSGLSTGIDFNQIVDDIIKVKRIPIDSIETRITANKDEIAALEELRGLLTGLRDKLDDVRGKVSLGNAEDIFAAKQVFATTSRKDSQVPSAAANLLGASTTNAASVGSHTLEVLRVATAHKVATKSFATENTALGFSGTFDVTGTGGTGTVTVSATDTLLDIRDRINNTNTGANASGVSASIVQAATNDFVLVITSEKTGQRMTITDTGSVLSSLGISSTNGMAGSRTGLSNAASKIDATNDGFKQIAFDGTQSNNAYKLSYSQSTKGLTMTRGDGTSQTVTLSSTAIAAGKTETVTFSTFGATVVLDENFSKTSDLLVDADTVSVTGGTGAIDAATVAITDSVGSISSIASTTLTIGNLGTPNNLSISVGGYSGTFDGSKTGLTPVVLTNGSNSLTIQFNVTTVFNGSETAASIDLQELENLVASSGTPFSNELQSAQSSRFTADGLLDPDRHESKFIASSASTLASLAPGAGSPGTFDIVVGGENVKVNYTGTDTLSALVTAINTEITGAGSGNAVFDAGTTASLMTDGDGVRLVITNTSGAAITLTDTNNLLAGLEVDNKLVIERSSNTVSDVFEGVTLSLFQAEEGTEVKLDVEQNLTSAKTAIQEFATAYNSLKSFLNEHSRVDSATGQVTEDTGILFGTSTLLGVTSQIATEFSQETKGVDAAFKVLAQIGVKFVDNDSITDPLLKNTLEVDETVLDEALLNNADDVRRLFNFDFSSSDPRVTLLDYTGQTTHTTSGYTLNLNFDDRFHSNKFTVGGSVTLVQAQTGGPATDGISQIAFGDPVDSGAAYRYSYNGTTEVLTLHNLTTNTTESVDITTTLDGIGNGGDLDAGETAAISFNSLNATITLSGDNGFARGTNISDGTLDTSHLAANGLTMTGGAVTTPSTGINKATVDALIAAGAYNATTGLLTLGITSSGAGEAHFDLASGIKFRVDGGSILADITGVDLDDAGAHTVDVYVNDGSSDIMVGTLNFTSLASAGANSGNLTIDLGTGLFGETSTAASGVAPMENYVTFTNGQFEVRDSSSTLLGTVTYNKDQSLTTLANNITANVSNVTASVVNEGGTFKLEVVHDTRDTLTFSNDTGTLLSQFSMVNGGDAVFTANINGASNGHNDLSVTVSGRTITATSLTGAEGLKIFYAGVGDTSAVNLNYTVGFGARLYHTIDQMLTPVSGLIDSNIETLKEQNKLNESRVDEMLLRLNRTREILLDKFIRMEAALAQARNLQENLQETFDAMFSQKR